MSHYVHVVALYGIALFAAGVTWEVVSAIYRNLKSPTLPFGRGTSYDSGSVKHSREEHDYRYVGRA